jgi:hypothetical protein
VVAAESAPLVGTVRNVSLPGGVFIGSGLIVPKLIKAIPETANSQPCQAG